MTGKASITMAIGLWALAGPSASMAESRYSNGGWLDPSAQHSPEYSGPATRDYRDNLRMQKLLEEMRHLIRDA